MGMKLVQLNEAMGYIDDQYLDMAVSPKKEIMEMSTNRSRKTIGRIVLVAAIIMMLAITAYATDFMNIKTLRSGTSKRYESYGKMDKAMQEAGFQMDVTETFQNGYTFESVSVDDTNALDENGKKVFSYQELCVYYRNPSGQRLVLFAHEDLAEIPHTNSPVAQSMGIGETVVSYKVDHYKLVPEDYTPTEEDKTWMELPGNYISYGAEQVEESDVAFLTWSKNGIAYTIMDPKATEEPETLFAMAEELING